MFTSYPTLPVPVTTDCKPKLLTVELDPAVTESIEVIFEELVEVIFEELEVLEEELLPPPHDARAKRLNKVIAALNINNLLN